VCTVHVSVELYLGAPSLRHLCPGSLMRKGTYSRSGCKEKTAVCYKSQTTPASCHILAVITFNILLSKMSTTNSRVCCNRSVSEVLFLHCTKHIQAGVLTPLVEKKHGMHSSNTNKIIYDYENRHKKAN